MRSVTRSRPANKGGLPRLAGLAVAAALLLLAAACQKGAGKAPEKRRISLYHYFSGSRSGGMAEMVADFNARNPEYVLEPTSIDHEAFKSGIVEILNSGNPPDLFSSWAGARTAAAIGDLRPIDALWSASGMKLIIPESLAKAASQYGGREYLVPISQHYACFFYNKQVFSRLGLSPPKDWAAFLAACGKLKAAGVLPIALGAKAGWPAQYWFDYLLLGTAGRAYREDLMRGEASYLDPQVRAAFRLWKELVDRGYFPAHPAALAWDADAAKAVKEGGAGMTLMGTWILGYWKNQDPRNDEGSAYGSFPFPVIDPGVKRAWVGLVDGIAMPALAFNPEGAERVLEYLAGESGQTAMARGSGGFAPNRLVDPSIYSPAQREVKDSIGPDDAFSLQYDDACPPAVAEQGLAMFSEFLEFPWLYPSLLEGMQSRTRSSY